ncbi:hypothetical protein ACFSC4_10655 [Deinococcus malanensis]|uniref:hypothetical protein n=1 Tax=Deinococcus malanensis TaxID=1706855 RepID=UPI003638301D
MGAAGLHSGLLVLGQQGLRWPAGLLDLVYLSVVGLAVALSVQVWRTGGPHARPALGALTLALMLYATGDLLWTWLSLFTRNPLFPSVADFFTWRSTSRWSWPCCGCLISRCGVWTRPGWCWTQPS